MNLELEWMVLAFAIGAIIALSELLSRYSWKIKVIVSSCGGWLYMALNGSTAILVYCASVEWEFYAGLEGKSEFWRTIVVSFLAMAVLRSSFFNVKIGNREFGAGFSAFIDIFKGYAERSLDQSVAQKHLEAITPLVCELTYAASKDYLYSMCEGSLRSVAKTEMANLNKDLEKIDKMEVNDSTKMRLFAVRISEVTGLKLFKCLAADAKNNLSNENALVAQQQAAKRKELAFIRSRL